MAALFPPSLLGSAIEEFINVSKRQPDDKMEYELALYTKNFDPKLLFLGKKDGPLKLCQNLLETIVNHPVFCTSRPTISVPSLIPNALDHLPVTAQEELQFVTLGNKFNWRTNDLEALLFVTDYESVKLEGTKDRREIALEDFMDDQKLKRENLFGVIYQTRELLWLSSIYSAKVFYFRKRLASALKIPMDRVFWIQRQNDFIPFIERIMYHVYRWRTDKECEENEKIVQGEYEGTEETKKQELYGPVTKCYGDIPDKKGNLVMEFSKVKMSYVHKLPIRPLECRTITTILDIQANNNPHRDAFVFYTSSRRSSYTFRQIQEMSLSLAASLLHIGWKRGHKIVLMIPKQIEFVVSYIALLRIGINVILVPVHGWPADKIITQMKRIGCNGLIIHADSISFFDLQGIGRDLGPMVLIGAGDFHIDISKGDCISYEKLLKEGEALDETDEVLKNQEEIQMDDPATALFTPGTSEQPKAVQFTHHALVNSMLLSAVKDPTKRGTMGMRMFSDRPFSLVGGLGSILAVMARGSTAVMAPTIKTVKEKDIDFVLNILQNEKCSSAILMYYIISDMLRSHRLGNYDLSSLKVIKAEGQAIPVDVLRKFKAIFPHCHLMTAYGLSEFAAPIGTRRIPPNALIEDQSIHVGMEITPSFEVKIIDETSNLVPVGTVGKITVRSPVAFLEYLDAAEETSKVISRTRWVHTGDIGRIDESGRLTICCGRKSEIIKRATIIKIYPTEIEQRLIKHPDVGKVIMVGVPESRLFEELSACVIPTRECSLDSNVFGEWDCLNSLVDEQGLSVKPKYTLVLEEFPLTKTGKIDRMAVKNIAIKKA